MSKSNDDCICHNCHLQSSGSQPLFTCLLLSSCLLVWHPIRLCLNYPAPAFAIRPSASLLMRRLSARQPLPACLPKSM